MKKNVVNIIHNVSIVLFFLAAATLTGAIFQHLNFHESNVVIIYVFSVLLVSRFTKGYLYGITASVISLLLFNWFFTEPYYTLKVNDMTYLITFAIMTLTSIMTSALTTKVIQSAEVARERERESNALYHMTNHLTDAEDANAIGEVIVKSIGEVLGCSAAFICFDDRGTPETSFIQRRDDGTLLHRELTNGKELQNRMEKLHGSVEITDNHYYYPIYGKTSVLAVLQIPYHVGDVITESQTRMIHSIIESTALALEKLRSINEQAKSREEATREHYRANLLRAISHDIRTPLTGIMGTVEVLMSKMDKTDARYPLTVDIYEDTQWLHEMVENILNLTKLQDGKFKLNKQPEVIEEVIGVALTVIEKRFPGRNITIQLPDNVVFVPMDAKLISQVIINLLDNAVKHTMPEDEIRLSVSVENLDIIISIADRGAGIDKDDLPYIFQMFHTKPGKSPDAKQGVGLGLPICQSIVEAHGGNITAENREDGGAEFTFTLPIGDEL